MTAQPPALIDVAVVGRANIDLTVRIPHRPTPGRTVFSTGLTTTPGGKSLNQALAVAHLHGQSRLIANAGADTWGQQLHQALDAAGVDTTSFRLIPHATTAAAIIEVTPDGEPHIVLAISPETELTAADVVHGLTQQPARVVVSQLDLPPNAIDGLLQAPRPALLIGNLVPHPDTDLRVLTEFDMFVVNQHEAAAVLQTDTIDALHAAKRLRHLGPSTVVVTAGANGAAYSSADAAGIMPALNVAPIDTSGAGDAFLGALALALSHGTPLPEAVITANRVGSHAVQHQGASLPIRSG